METICVKGRSRTSRILAGRSIGQLPAQLAGREVFVITDANVHAAHASVFPDHPAYVMPPGEAGKTADTAALICRWLLERGAGRDAFILGFGGGVVCDMAGFIASIFMRGVDFGFVATSLLAQVDGSVGGKNGVNLDGYKNMLGTFNQPHFVICDSTLLTSLPREEVLNGFAEVVKHALIADKGMLRTIGSNVRELLALDPRLTEKVVVHSIRVKAAIVGRDEVEAGERRKLNLGHTWGHAVERTDNIPHGQAVSIGLVFAARFSEHRGLLQAGERAQVVSVLSSLGLPTQSRSQPDAIFRSLAMDKKRAGDHIRFVFMKGLGRVVVEAIPLKALYDFALQ